MFEVQKKKKKKKNTENVGSKFLDQCYYLNVLYVAAKNQHL